MTTSSSRRGRNRQRGPHGRPDAPERHHQDLVLKRTRVIHTIGWHEIPHWQRDNEFILTGYRRCGMESFWSSVDHFVVAAARPCTTPR